MSYFVKSEDGKLVIVKGKNVHAQDFVDAEIKDYNNTERSLVAVANAESADRLGDIVMVDGWDLKNYRKNPVVMPFHNYSVLPVGRSLEEWTDEKKGVKRLMYRPQFAAYPETMRMYEMYRDKYLKGFSVGFLPFKQEDIEQDDKDKKKKPSAFSWRTPQRFLKQELLEVSVAPIPAHPDALSEVRAMVQKGELYIPAHYLTDKGAPEIENFVKWIHATVNDPEKFTKLYQDTFTPETLGAEVIVVFGRMKEEDENEFFPFKFIVSCCEIDEDELVKWIEEESHKFFDVLATEQKSDDPPSLRIYDEKKYTDEDTILIEEFKTLDEDAFVKDEADEEVEDDEEDDFDLSEVEGLPDGAVLITRDEAEKPYPSEHACRLNDPGKYDKFARKNCYRKSGGKCVDYIFGIKAGKSETQALRYKKATWTAAAAKAHCKKNKGTFEAASGNESIDQMMSLLNDSLKIFTDKLSKAVGDVKETTAKLLEFGEKLNKALEKEPEPELQDKDVDLATDENEPIIVIVDEQGDQETEERTITLDGVEEEDLKSMIGDAFKSATGRLTD